jgi:hypothetical protein
MVQAVDENPAAIRFRLTAAQMSVIWPGLDIIVQSQFTRQQSKRVLYAYPFRLYPPPAGFDLGIFDEQMMANIDALWKALRPKATVGGRVQMNCIQIRAAIFAIRSNLGLWRRRKYDERRMTPETKKRFSITKIMLRNLMIKSQRVIRTLERHLKRANRFLQSLVSPEDYAAYMDAWKKHLQWMKLRLVYFKPLRPKGISSKRKAQYIVNMLVGIAVRGLRTIGYQSPEPIELRKMMRLYAQYARRGRELQFTLPFLLRNEKDIAAAKHLANFVLRRLTLQPRP